MFVASFIAQTSPASAQTFESYRCADGTQFILAFYPGDKRAYLQIDGHAVTLKKGVALPGKRYSGSGVNLVMTATGIRLKHARRPVTACEL
jgi:membrane-bound inhibitor of C-type lysozyme